MHVQDPQIALIMEILHRRGLSRPNVILAHGTEEPPEFLSKFSNLQHLAPCYLEDWERHKIRGHNAFAIPNFVDTNLFSPGDRASARNLLGLPQKCLIVLCVAAIKKGHKRIDVLVKEFDLFRKQYSGSATLVVAGARETETDEVRNVGNAVLGDNVRFIEGASRDKMPALYRAADIFAMASLHEMMPIAMLEALSTGLPVCCNSTPVMNWMTGAAAVTADIREQGALASQMLAAATDPDVRRTRGEAARNQAVRLFSANAVIGQMIEMYREVMK